MTAHHVFHASCDTRGCATVLALTVEHGIKCRKLARKLGWRVRKDGRCLCPTCVENRKRDVS